MNFKMLCYAAFLLVASIVLVGKADSVKQRSSGAYLVRTKLAGVQMDVTQKDFIWFDAASGYYLAKTGSNWEHFGVNLILTPDRKKIPFIDKTTMKSRQVRLPRLQNGSGINIGDTVAQMRRKLGEEPEYFYVEDKSLVRTEIYYGIAKMPTPQKSGGPKLKTYYYSAKYAFLQGKLRTIEYNLVAADQRV